MKYIKYLIYYWIFKYYKWIIDRSNKKIKKLDFKLRVEKRFNKVIFAIPNKLEVNHRCFQRIFK